MSRILSGQATGIGIGSHDQGPLARRFVGLWPSAADSRAMANTNQPIRNPAAFRTLKATRTPRGLPVTGRRAIHTPGAKKRMAAMKLATYEATVETARSDCPSRCGCRNVDSSAWLALPKLDSRAVEGTVTGWRPTRDALSAWLGPRLRSQVESKAPSPSPSVPAARHARRIVTQSDLEGPQI